MKITFILALLLCSVASQTTELDKSYSELLGAIFTSPKTTIATTESASASASTPKQKINLQPTKGNTSDCECVPRFQCKSNNDTLTKFGYNVINIRIEGPCEYLSTCCELSDKLGKPDTNTRSPQVKKPKGCGIRNPEGVGYRIEGNINNESQFGEFPWMVALLRKERDEKNNQEFVYQCGASLLHPQVVLTAAHCIQKNAEYYVRAGEWDTQTELELYAHQDREVKTYIIHPEYVEGVLFNDAAILILDRPFDIVENVDTVCLPEQGLVVDGARCYSGGWGKDMFGQKGVYQAILKSVDLPAVRNDICLERLRTTKLGPHFQLHHTFMCAGGEKGKDTCTGDGGSPLVCPITDHPGRYYQVGIVAWGIGCGEDQIPGVYANVAKFRKWIDEQFDAHNLDKSYYTY